jgi:transmembrane sensor
VQTAQGTLRAIGTRFAVRLYEAATHVSVFEGAVELQPLHGAPARVLQAGQQALFGADAIMPALAADEDSIAWTDGFLIAKGMRLRDFLAELNRYSEVALSCAPQAAALRVSGSYPLDDIMLVLETLSAALDLNIETSTRFWGRYRSGIRLTPKIMS